MGSNSSRPIWLTLFDFVKVCKCYCFFSSSTLGFSDAASPMHASKLFDFFVQQLEEHGISVKKGLFGADMEVVSTNWGPVILQFGELDLSMNK